MSDQKDLSLGQHIIVNINQDLKPLTEKIVKNSAQKDLFKKFDFINITPSLARIPDQDMLKLIEIWVKSKGGKLSWQ